MKKKTKTQFIFQNLNIQQAAFVSRVITQTQNKLSPSRRPGYLVKNLKLAGRE